MSAMCPACERVHCAAEVRAVGRFQPQPSGYRHDWSPRVFDTRAEAEADLCRIRAGSKP